MNKTYYFSSIIGTTINSYLNLKRSLGRQYTEEYSILKNLDLFLCTVKKDLTSTSFTDWCKTQEHLAAGVRRNRMRIIRNFCLYRQRNKICFVPDELQFPTYHQSIQPHIFTNNQIVSLLDAIKKLKPTSVSPIRQENLTLALVLLYTTGLRRGELCKLTIGDYDKKEHTLLIRESKFHKSRIIPLSYDGWNALEIYLKKRNLCKTPTSMDSPLLWNNIKKNRAGFYTGTGIGIAFNSLFLTTNILTIKGIPPRLHDFRHTFAVHALLRWYDKGADLQTKLPLLSTYMGHVSIVSTQYYLRFIEDIVCIASKRFEKNYGKLITKSNKRGKL